VLGRTGPAELSVGSDDIDGQEVVARQAEAAHEVAEPATQREPGYACGRHEAAGRGQAKGLGLPVELRPGDTRFSTSCAPSRVDPNPLHPGEVDHKAAVAHGQARHIVATPMHRHQQAVVPGEIDGGDDICGPSTAGDKGGAPVDHAVPDRASVLVGLVRGTEQLSPQARFESFDSRPVKDRVRPYGGGDAQVCHTIPPFG
jgi:hypothetical protein